MGFHPWFVTDGPSALDVFETALARDALIRTVRALPERRGRDMTATIQHTQMQLYHMG